MEQEHRTKILSNIDKLIRFTNYDFLVRACLSQNLLSQLIVDEIQVSVGTVCQTNCCVSNVMKCVHLNCSWHQLKRHATKDY